MDQQNSGKDSYPVDEGLEVIASGVVAAEEWHPELGEPVPGQEGVHSGAYVAVARRA
ncbi:hypothetical protein AB0941_05200 [Streptomyces sp. NPDC013433]|uniref:hypothetical protein n=1 Tax=Streptomyces sp. NPDC013433 TaxID=3155604 RepID=UPI0034540E27